jgi:hypothetical protein
MLRDDVFENPDVVDFDANAVPRMQVLRRIKADPNADRRTRGNNVSGL